MRPGSLQRRKKQKMSETSINQETEVEYRRGLVTKVVIEINKPNNYEGFKKSVIEMFSAFGIPYTDNLAMQEVDESKWKQSYEGWQRSPLVYSDIEIHGPNVPDHPNWVPYANINIKRMSIGNRAIPVDLIVQELVRFLVNQDLKSNILKDLRLIFTNVLRKKSE